MNKMMKMVSVLVAVMMVGSISMADSYRGGGHGDGGRGYHGCYDGGRHYGYYRNDRGELFFGLLGLGVLAAVISSADRPVYVQQPVYLQQPVVVQEPPQVIYYQQSQQVVQQPVIIQQPAQYEPAQPFTTTINIQNSNGSFTPVLLRQVGARWVGPKGEYYDGVPSVGQLRPVYGF